MVIIILTFVAALFFTSEHFWNAHKVITQTEREGVTPNYYEIATMEIAIWGQAYHINNSNCHCMTCTRDYIHWSTKYYGRPWQSISTGKPIKRIAVDPWQDRYGE